MSTMKMLSTTMTTKVKTLIEDDDGYVDGEDDVDDDGRVATHCQPGGLPSSHFSSLALRWVKERRRRRVEVQFRGGARAAVVKGRGIRRKR